MHHNFLVIQLRQFGDVLCCTPFLRALKTAHPDSKIFFLTEKIGMLALANNPLIEKILLLPKTKSGYLQTIFELRKLKFSAAFDLMNIPKTAFLCFSSGIDIRIGFKKAGRSLFYTHAPKKPENLKEYMPLTKCRLLKELNIYAESHQLEFYPETVSSSVQSWITNHLADPTVAFCPVGRRGARFWIKSYWAELADMIQQQMNMQILLVYGPGEEKEIQEISDMCRYKPLIPPPTNFSDLAHILKSCTATVSNDTGPKHLSIAMHTPTLGINGPTIAECWTPPDSIHRFITADVPCLGCEQQECDDLKCMKTLKPQTVFEKLCSMLT